jgi:hypothetical protein
MEHPGRSSQVDSEIVEKGEGSNRRATKRSPCRESRESGAIVSEDDERCSCVEISRVSRENNAPKVGSDRADWTTVSR